jgi:hypothetical protein
MQMTASHPTKMVARSHSPTLTAQATMTIKVINNPIQKPGSLLHRSQWITSRLREEKTKASSKRW